MNADWVAGINAAVQLCNERYRQNIEEEKLLRDAGCHEENARYCNVRFREDAYLATAIAALAKAGGRS